MRRQIRVIAASACFLASALSSSQVDATPAAWERCFIDAGLRYSVSPLLLRAIARQESSFRPDAIGKNTNGTHDIGIMQINSWWLKTLRPAGIDESKLMDPCLNIHVGAWILANEIARHGLTWTAVGAYHSPTDWRRADYAVKINKHLARELRALGVEIPDVGGGQAGRTQSKAESRPTTTAEVSPVPERRAGVWEAIAEAGSDESPSVASSVDTFRPAPARADGARVEAGSD